MDRIRSLWKQFESNPIAKFLYLYTKEPHINI